jgi:N4-gp56 family major capsid protein
MMFLTAAGRSYGLKTNGSSREAGSQLEQLKYASDVTAASSNRIVYAGSATSEGTLTASDKFSWETIVRSCTYAHRKGIRPIRQKGKEYYAIVISPEQKRDLLLDNTYQTIVGRAAERGHNNPLFTNALAVVSGAILYEHRKVFNTTGMTSGSKWGSGGTVDGAQAQLMGAQALGFATIGAAKWAESDKTDYGNRPGVAYGQTFGILKPKFKPTASSTAREDYGTVAIKTAAAI